MNTAAASVPGHHHEPEGDRGWWRWWYAVALTLVAATGLAAALLPIPYYSIAPASAVSADDFVEVDGAPTFPSEGEVLFATVSLRHVTVLEAVRGWIDPTISVVEQDFVIPPQIPPSELREFNRDLMELSQRSALVVAFQRLGYDVVERNGARVAQVAPESPSAGVVSEGDTIVALEGQAVSTMEQLVELLGHQRPGAAVQLTVEDVDGNVRQVEITLGSHPETPDRAFLGLTLFTRFALNLPFEVDIKTSTIGGPSAGLAFTLQLLDELTEGELTGGLRVAATGTIELDGTVGSVGGVAQKAVAVTRADADVFLVPAGEAELARRHAGGDVRVEGVESLDDALRILADAGGDGLGLPHPQSEEA